MSRVKTVIVFSESSHLKLRHAGSAHRQTINMVVKILMWIDLKILMLVFVINEILKTHLHFNSQKLNFNTLLFKILLAVVIISKQIFASTVVHRRKNK